VGLRAAGLGSVRGETFAHRRRVILASERGGAVGSDLTLMVLLFALGAMNLFWIAALAILVLLEKVMPSGRVIARIAGIVSFAGGLWMLFQPS
jgi:predicted metal-binding membrane protein